jgi:hypothetical protein
VSIIISTSKKKKKKRKKTDRHNPCCHQKPKTSQDFVNKLSSYTKQSTIVTNSSNPNAKNSLWMDLRILTRKRNMIAGYEV